MQRRYCTISDIEKWSLYNQALHRYLYFAKQANHRETHPSGENKILEQQTQIFDDSFMSSPVRHFFENARKSNASEMLPQHQQQPLQQPTLQTLAYETPLPETSPENTITLTPRAPRRKTRKKTTINFAVSPTYVTRSRSANNNNNQALVENWVHTSLFK